MTFGPLLGLQAWRDLLNERAPDRPTDPYFIWADLTQYRAFARLGVDLGKSGFVQRLTFAIELAPGASIVELNKHMMPSSGEPYFRVTPTYSEPLPNAALARFVTAALSIRSADSREVRPRTCLSNRARQTQFSERICLDRPSARPWGRQKPSSPLSMTSSPSRTRSCGIGLAGPASPHFGTSRCFSSFQTSHGSAYPASTMAG